MIAYRNTRIYYPLTIDECSTNILHYDNTGYDCKIVHLDLYRLVKYINKTPEIRDLLKYYTIVSLENFNIKKNIILKEQNTLAVEIPFTIHIVKIFKLYNNERI